MENLMTCILFLVLLLCGSSVSQTSSTRFPTPFTSGVVTLSLVPTAVPTVTTAVNTAAIADSTAATSIAPTSTVPAMTNTAPPSPTRAPPTKSKPKKGWMGVVWCRVRHLDPLYGVIIMGGVLGLVLILLLALCCVCCRYGRLKRRTQFPKNAFIGSDTHDWIHSNDDLLMWERNLRAGEVSAQAQSHSNRPPPYNPTSKK